MVGAAGVNSLDTWLGTMKGTAIQSGLADGVPGVDRGSSAINLFTCKVSIGSHLEPPQ